MIYMQDKDMFFDADDMEKFADDMEEDEDKLDGKLRSY